MNPSDELIEKYLDGLITPEEISELNDAIVNNPAIAEAFHDAARMDHLLIGHFNRSGAIAQIRVELDQARESMEYRYRPQRRALYWHSVLDHLWGPVGSLAVHVLLIFLLIRFVVYEPVSRSPEVEVVLMEPEATDLESFEQELESLDALPEMTDPRAAAAVRTDGIHENIPDGTIDFAAMDIFNEVQSPLVMRGLFKGRTAAGRQAMRQQYAGKWGQHTESAVIKALQWLKQQQAPNGSWGPDRVALTGLGLLTFLAHGETTASAEYGLTVENALHYLLACQDTDGHFMQADTQTGPCAHGIATYAISEAYSMTRIPALKPVMEKAVQVIIAARHEVGEWNYENGVGLRPPVAGWQIQALKAAELAGSTNQTIQLALEKTVKNLERKFDPEAGRFRYTNQQRDKDGGNAIGILCMQLLGEGQQNEVYRALRTLPSAECDEEQPGPWTLYGWYCITQAKFHHGGSDWVAWNTQIAKMLTGTQNKDGSWSFPYMATDQPACPEVEYGPVYATTMAALTLQVYYRFLPTYKAPLLEKRKSGEDSGVTVEIQ